MPPAGQAQSESEDESDLPPSDDEDVEAAKPAKGEVTQPLLSNGKGGKQPVSDDSKPPMSPRDKMRQLGATTPRSKAAEAQKIAEDALADPAAAVAALAASDPAAAKAMEMAQKIKEDPKAAALAAAEAIKNVKPPTAEELKASAEAAKKEADEARAAAEELWKDMMEDKPPPCWPLADISKRMDRYIDLLISAVPEGKLPPNVQAQLKPGIVMAIKVISASSGWIMYITRWTIRIWNMLPWNITQMIFGIALCYFGGTFTTSIAAAEAFRTMGGEKAKSDLVSVYEQLKPAIEYA